MSPDVCKANGVAATLIIFLLVLTRYTWADATLFEEVDGGVTFNLLAEEDCLQDGVDLRINFRDPIFLKVPPLVVVFELDCQGSTDAGVFKLLPVSLI